MVLRDAGQFYQSPDEALDDLQKDELAAYPMEVDRNATGEVVKIRIFKNEAVFEQTITGHTAGDVVVETLIISGWNRIT